MSVLQSRPPRGRAGSPRFRSEAVIGFSRPVPDAGLGQDHRRIRRIEFDLLPELAHVGPQILRVLLVSGSPYRRENVLVRDDLARMAGQDGQEIELSRRELDLLA